VVVVLVVRVVVVFLTRLDQPTNTISENREDVMAVVVVFVVVDDA
jgi:hypothetical protein